MDYISGGVLAVYFDVRAYSLGVNDATYVALSALTPPDKK
jgi:hypothetical protein